MDPEIKEQLSSIRSGMNEIYSLLCKIENECLELLQKLETKKTERSSP